MYFHIFYLPHCSYVTVHRSSLTTHYSYDSTPLWIWMHAKDLTQQHPKVIPSGVRHRPTWPITAPKLSLHIFRSLLLQLAIMGQHKNHCIPNLLHQYSEQSCIGKPRVYDIAMFLTICFSLWVGGNACLYLLLRGNFAYKCTSHSSNIKT